MDFCKIGKVQAIAAIFIVMLNHLILNLIKNMYTLTGNSILLNTLWIIIIMGFFIFLVLKLFKHFKGQDILDISNYLGGKKLQILTATLYIVFFVFVAGILLRNFVEGIRIIYYAEVPVYILLMLILLVGVVANKSGANSVFKFNSIIVFFMMISLFFILLTSTTTYVPEKIFPLFGNGINETFFSGLSNIYAFSGFGLLYFLMPILKDYKDFKKISIWALILSSLYLFFAILTLLFSFSSLISVYELSPIYLVLRATEFGQFFQRPDAIFVFTWILSIMSFISILILFCSINLKKAGNIKNMKMLSYTFASLIFIVSLLPNDLAVIRNIQDVFYRYGTIFLVFIFSPLVLLFANLKYKKKHKNQITEVDLDDSQ